ncbi:putative F-box domain-containing protein [Helianthus annuus]|nr:putative F-box domain-containing protein [Helianthus annuus]
MEEDSDHQPTQSGALIGSNDDLLTEILLRLPVTSILRFKSVSKHWRLHLRHTHFTHRYDKIQNLLVFLLMTLYMFRMMLKTQPLPFS